MRPEDYPIQDELSDFARPYAKEVERRSFGILGEDQLFGDDPYQSVGIHKAADPNGHSLSLFWQSINLDLSLPNISTYASK